MMTNIQIRPATREDALLIAQAVFLAIGEKTSIEYCGPRPIQTLVAMAQSDDSQYSYRNAFVAEADGQPAGAVVGYDGALLKVLRSATFRILQEQTGKIPDVEEETAAGEFYIDTLAVLPPYQGLGLGRRLLQSMTNHAFAEGHLKVGLLVDFDNPRAEKLYAGIGFLRVAEKSFFGHRMWHMQTDSSSSRE